MTLVSASLFFGDDVYDAFCVCALFCACVDDCGQSRRNGRGHLHLAIGYHHDCTCDAFCAFYDFYAHDYLCNLYGLYGACGRLTFTDRTLRSQGQLLEFPCVGKMPNYRFSKLPCLFINACQSKWSLIILIVPHTTILLLKPYFE